MSVWVCMPSARDAATVNECLRKWHDMGYNTAVLRDAGAEPVEADLTEFVTPYPGWGGTINLLAKRVFQGDPYCHWIVGGSDDIEPDPNVCADTIAEQCSIHFRGREDCAHLPFLPPSFGVMQPTGDRFAFSGIDRICGSPWLGREFCRRMYGGRGPMNPEYRHMFDDEELQEVAVKLGALWQRPDLVHLHMHFMRATRAIDSPALVTQVPAHLVAANSAEHWNKNKALFLSRKAAGFPGHEPIP